MTVLSSRNALKRRTWALFMFFFLPGLLMASWATRTPAIRDILSVSTAEMGCSGSQKARTRSKKDATPCCVAFYVNYWPECSDLGYG